MTPVGTPLVGLEGTEDFGTTDLVLDVDRMVKVHDRDSAPLMTYLSHTSGRMVPSLNEDYFWQEVQYDYTRHAITAGLTGGAATEANVIIDSPEFVVGDTFAHPDSGQYFIVESVTRDTTTSTCTIRGIGADVQATAGPMTIVPTGVALADGSFYPEARGIRPTRPSNTVTVRSAAVEVTHGADRATTYFGSLRQMANQRAITKFRKDMERDILHSNYAVVTGYTQTNPNGSRTGATIRFTRGILRSIDNIDTYTGDLTEDTWDDFLANNVWSDEYKGSFLKLAFFGSESLLKFHKSLKTRLRILNGPNAKKYGLRIMEYETQGGESVLIFKERNFFVSPWKKGVLVLDPDFIRLRYNGSNMMEIYDTSIPRQSARSLAVEANYGVELSFKEAHAGLKQAG